MTVSLSAASLDVGYEDAASFRRLFKRVTGLTPAEHRKMFGRRRFEDYTSDAHVGRLPV